MPLLVRLYGTYKEVTGKLGAGTPDSIPKNLYWQHSSCINQGIFFVSSCYKVISDRRKCCQAFLCQPYLSSPVCTFLLHELP